MKKKSIWTHLFFFSSVILWVLLDQLSKSWAREVLKRSGRRVLVKGVLELTYVENTGMAFGLAKGFRWVLILCCVVAVGWLLSMYLRTKEEKASGLFSRLCHLLWYLGLSWTMGGAIGNGIDRALSGAVVDFLEIRLFTFPVFNLADCFVVVGIILLFLLIRREEV